MNRRVVKWSTRAVVALALGLTLGFTSGCASFGGRARPVQTKSTSGDSAEASPLPGKGLTEQGWASWYGKRFQGRKTASGERFNMKDLTAAHRTLPFGTRLQVTDLKTHRSVEVRINDRGPRHRDRLIDLSYEAAKRLGIVSAGMARVEIKQLL